jgi:hypothetical protein
MAKCSTLKKSKNDSLLISNEHYMHIEQTIDNTVLYIKQWTRTELLSLLSTSTDLLCIKLNKSTYLIGKFLITQIDNNYWSVQGVSSNDYYIFSSRSIAVIYALCECKRYSKLALEILKHDTNIIKLSEELVFYTYQRNTAKSKHDNWKIDHYGIMESSVTYKLEDAKMQLKKSLHLAKYFKI